jgi:hypothetical protein
LGSGIQNIFLTGSEKPYKLLYLKTHKTEIKQYFLYSNNNVMSIAHVAKFINSHTWILLLFKISMILNHVLI